MKAVLAGVLALILAADVAAQSPAAPAGKLPVPLLQPGKPVKVAGSDRVTVYAFDGGAGLSIGLNLQLVGEGGLLLHAPDGTPMLQTTGTGSVDLAAILPGDNVYYVSVLRAQGAQPASLKLEVTEPDLHLAVFASGIGYTWRQLDESKTEYEVKSCWVEPGLKFRRIHPFGYEDGTLGRGGKEFGSWLFKSGKAGSSERSLTFADASATFHFTDGRADAVVKLDDLIFFASGEPYHRYLCGDGDK